jgi:hypothetical protein
MALRTTSTVLHLLFLFESFFVIRWEYEGTDIILKSE